MNSPVEASRSKSVSARAHLATLVAVGLLILLPGSGVLPVQDRDEPRFAQATVEMMQSGNWLIPHFNGDYRFDKPVMTYWLMSVGYRIFGRNELGARFHSILAAIAIACALYLFGRRWRNARAGLFAGFAWLTGLQILVHGRSAVADMPMILAVVLAQGAFYELLHEADARKRRPWFWLAYLSLAFGFLVKGPIALLAPGLTLILFRLFLRRPLEWKRLQWIPGLVLVLVLVGAWGIPALISTHGAFWKVGINRHVVDRGLEAFNHRRFLPLVYYPATAFMSLFPWIAFAGWMVSALRRARSPQALFLLAWFLAPYLIFSLYATQLPHYTMPAFPAFMLLFGIAMDTATPWTRGARILFWVSTSLIGIAALAVSGLAVAWPLAVLSALRAALMGIAMLLFGLLGLAWMIRREAYAKLWIPLVLIVGGPLWIGSGLRAVHPAVQAQPWVADLPPSASVAAYRYLEPSLVFYGHRPWTMLPTRPDALKAWADEKGGPRVVVALEQEAKLGDLLAGAFTGKPVRKKSDYSAELDSALDSRYAMVARYEGLNSARGTWVTIRVMMRPD